jgi:LCP family protein required for cell wall assembly
MKKSHSSIDGFIPRQLGNHDLSGVHNRNTHKNIADAQKTRQLGSSSNTLSHTLGTQKTSVSVARSDIDESLRDIDNIQEPINKLSRRQRRRIAKMTQKRTHRVKRVIKWIILLTIIATLAVGGYLVYKFFAAGGNIFQGNIFDVFQSQPLKQDSNGRSNFLLLGTSEDDPGHDGANLTDSMLVVSIDQNKKSIYMFSIPRDLYVDYGEACTSGYSGKINAYFSCSDEGATAQAEQNRLTKIQKLVGDIFGLDIQYGVHVNHTVIQEAVNAVGGIDVDIQGSNGAPGILDRNFDWRCRFNCYLVKYTNGVHHLDGEHALFLSMARGDIAPTYGLGNSNFDREKNQQKILLALKKKAMSTGTLTNLDAITKLIDSFGKNLRTNIRSSEIRTIMQVVNEVKTADIHTLSLFGTDDSSLFKTGSYGGASVVMPSAGIYNYRAIQAFIKKNLNSNPVIREAAPIAVFNGSGQSGLGKTKADNLTRDGFNVTQVDTAPDGVYGKVEIYQIGTGNSNTAAKLSSMFKVKISKKAPPVSADGNVKFVIIFG